MRDRPLTLPFSASGLSLTVEDHGGGRELALGRGGVPVRACNVARLSGEDGVRGRGSELCGRAQAL